MPTAALHWWAGVWLQLRLAFLIVASRKGLNILRFVNVYWTEKLNSLSPLYQISNLHYSKSWGLQILYWNFLGDRRSIAHFLQHHDGVGERCLNCSPTFENNQIIAFNGCITLICGTLSIQGLLCSYHQTGLFKNSHFLNLF